MTWKLTSTMRDRDNSYTQVPMFVPLVLRCNDRTYDTHFRENLLYMFSYHKMHEYLLPKYLSFDHILIYVIYHIEFVFSLHVNLKDKTNIQYINFCALVIGSILSVFIYINIF